MYIPRWLVAIVAVVAALALAAFQQPLTIARPTSPDFGGAAVHPSQLRSFSAEVQHTENGPRTIDTALPSSLSGPGGFVMTDLKLVPNGSNHTLTVELLEDQTPKLVTRHRESWLGSGEQSIAERADISLPHGLPFESGAALSLRTTHSQTGVWRYTITITGYAW